MPEPEQAPRLPTLSPVRRIGAGRFPAAIGAGCRQAAIRLLVGRREHSGRLVIQECRRVRPRAGERAKESAGQCASLAREPLVAG